MRECLDEVVLQSYLDRELSKEATESVRLHLSACLTCAESARELESQNQLVDAALAPAFEVNVPSERLRERIDAAIAGMHVIRADGPTSAKGRWFQSFSDLFRFTPQQVFGYAGLIVVLTFALVFTVIQRRNSQVAIETPPVKTVEQGSDNPKIAFASPGVSAPAPDLSPATVSIAASNRYRPRKNSIRHAAAPRTSAVANRVKLMPGERSYLQTIAELDTTIKSDRGQMKPALRAEYERNLAFVDSALAAARTAAKSNPSNPDAAQFMFSAYQNKVDLLNTVADARVYDRQH